MLRWALPSADRACQGRTGRVAVHGGGSRMQVRTVPWDCASILNPTGTRLAPTPRHGDRDSGRLVAGAGAADGFIDDPLRHVSQFAVFGLADRPQLGECVLGAAPAASAQQPD